jgi:hypothetical protein
MKPNMSVREVARKLGVSEQTVRVGLQQKAFPFGIAVKSSTKYTYVIPRDKFEDWRVNNGYS